MTYQNDPNRTGIRNDRSYTGWVVGGLVAIAVILGIFAMMNRGDHQNSASSSPTSTSQPATTGSDAARAPAPAAPAR